MSGVPAATVEVRGLSFRYPASPEPALRDVNFSVGAGERVGLLGPNGAGKTTVMRLVCGYLPMPPSRGSQQGPSIRVGDHDVRTASLAVREQVGYLPEQVPLYPELRVREHLAFRAQLKGIGRPARPGELRRVAGLTGLQEMLETPIHRLSRGYRQRVGIADALLGSPPLVVLDEPTVGLDPNQVQGIRSMLRDLGGSHTLVFSSHILVEVEALCDRIIVLSRGEVVADESVGEALREGDSLVAEWECDENRATAILNAAARDAELSGVPRWELVTRGGIVRATLDGGGPRLAAIVGRHTRLADVTLVRLEPGRRRLEEHFARVTGAVGEETE
ncbi:MAG: ABC transporter ATP-binding protein [Nannocystaceae bacterium]